MARVIGEGEMNWTHDVRGPEGNIVYFGTYEECIEWAALTGAERDEDYTVHAIV